VVACGQTCSSCYALFLPQQGQICDDDDDDDDILFMQIEYVSLRCQLKDTYVGNIGFSKSICLDSLKTLGLITLYPLFQQGYVDSSIMAHFFNLPNFPSCQCSWVPTIYPHIKIVTCHY